MLTVCRWCAEEILFPIVAARGYCSWDCQDDDPTSPEAGRPAYCEPSARRFAPVGMSEAPARLRHAPADRRHRSRGEGRVSSTR